MKNKTNKPWHFHWIWKILLINIFVLGSCDAIEDALPDDDPDLPNVSILNGEWLRVDGNNESANGMRVDVSNGSANILDPSSTSFSSGDIKWKDIRAVEEDLFEHQELGSDGLYYPATIEMINDDEIEINVGSGGSGNFQKWIRTSENEDYVKIQGLWAIVDLSATINLIIEVKGSAGTIIGGTGSTGEIVWKDIEPSGTNKFTVQILGADGKYYSATITIISETEIQIVIGSGDPQNYNRFDGSLDLTKIQGEWTRIESNNPSSDYMQVNVENDLATVIYKAQSGFNVGDIKWKDIMPTGDGNFTHQELGSDGNYYAASITIVNDSTLEIAVGSSGSGNAQKWVRNAPAVTVELECKINSETTLVNTPAEVDYRVKSNCVVDITAPLTIEPGVVIEFEENAGLGVYDNGTINAVGTSDRPIAFKGLSSTKGSWRGIHIETNSINNRFEYVTVKDAGSNYVYCCNDKASVFIKDGQFAIENSTIENGAAKGLYVNDKATLSDFSNVKITTHDDYPLSLSMQRAGELDGTMSDLTGNDDDYIEIHKAAIKNETTIEAASIPFMISDVIDITSGLNILKGAEFVMREDGGLGIYDNGYLNIKGTSNEKVIFRGYESVAGYWRGIHIETNSINNDIDHAKISDAGANYVYCCNEKASLFFKSGLASVKNTEISNGKNFGIYGSKDFQFNVFLNNTVTTHQDYPMYIAAERIGELDGMGSDYSGNSEDYIGIFDSNIANEITWSKTNIPYLIDGKVIDITDRVTIEKGTEIVFNENGGLGVYDNGVFNAVGTSGENIIFRGKSDVVGYWRGIHIETNSQYNVLDYCRVLNAGSNYVYCCNDKGAVFAKAGKLSVSNSAMEKSGGCGLLIKTGATVTQSNNTFKDNADGSVCE